MESSATLIEMLQTYSTAQRVEMFAVYFHIPQDFAVISHGLENGGCHPSDEHLPPKDLHLDTQHEAL